MGKNIQCVAPFFLQKLNRSEFARLRAGGGLFEAFQKILFEYSTLSFKQSRELILFWNYWWIILEFSEVKLVGQFVL